MSAQPRHFRHLFDLDATELRGLLDRARELKALRGKPAHPRPLDGKTVAIVLEKASTRTRVSFEVAAFELGAHPLTLIARDTQLGRGEPLEDTARMLSGFVHAVAFRTFGHDRVQRLAAHARIPVINALCDRYHPCQALADLMAVEEHLDPKAERPGEALSGARVAWIGDGNNVAHSWINAAALAGFEIVLACPDGYRPDAEVVRLAKEQGAKVTIVGDPATAVSGAHVVTTDVWASMGQEEETRDRQRAFEGFIVDGALMKRARPDAIFLHCLPAHRGEEVASEVIDGPQSRVWGEAENRLHTQKALLELLVV